MSDAEHRLGQLAVDTGLISKDQLQLSLALRQRADPQPSLGEVLVREGYLSRISLDKLLSSQGHLRGDQVSPPDRTLSTAEVRELLSGDLGDHLRVLRDLNASELHLIPGTPVLARIRGALTDLSPAPLDPGRCEELLCSALTGTQAAEFDRRHRLELVIDRPEGRYRACMFQERRGPSGVFTFIPAEVPDLETLGLPRILTRIPRMQQGLVLVTGPRTSGKTTTLAALVERMNAGRRRHIITIEQPIEYVFKSQHCLIAQREVGPHVPSFEAALNACLREDPDVIVVSDLGTPERITTALTAAETGHLVLGTMQTPTAMRTLLRILDAYAGRQRTTVRGMLASMLRMVVCQHLVPSLDGTGLEPAVEVLVANDAVSTMIRKDRLHQIPQVMQTSRGEGMQLLDDALSDLVSAKRISVDEALARALDPNRILRLIPTEQQ